jgi:hypothetical protein
MAKARIIVILIIARRARLEIYERRFLLIG